MKFLSDLTEVCSDAAMARSVGLIYQIIKIICIIVPIILIVMVTFSVISMVLDPDKKDGLKKIFKKVAAAVLIFLVPSFVNLAMNYAYQAVGNESTIFDISACWKKAEKAASTIADTTYESGAGTEAGKGILSMFGDLSGLKNYKKDTTTSASLGDGGILIIAGHSYSPYCAQAPRECREESNMKYLEPDQTRILAKLLKNELDKMNLKASIANEMLGGTDSRMNTSFYVERYINSEKFKEQGANFKKFTHAIQIHFNAFGSGAHGTLLMQTSQGIGKVDNELKEAVVKYTGRSLDNITNGLGDILYFQNLGIPMTYIEVEFYDNESAMDTYTANKEKIAHELALVFQKNYGSKISR